MSDTVHGLVYPDNLLESLPTLDANNNDNDNNAPIRLLSAAQLAELHLQHTLSHPPDNVLFPFLHGLEGDNHAQNAFFASSSGAAPTHTAGGGGNGGACSPNMSHLAFNHPFHHQHKLTPRIPKYRGLVWVVCEDDLEKAGDGVTLQVLRRKPVDGALSSSSSDEEDNIGEDETSDEFDDDFDEDDELMIMGDERLHGHGIIASIDADADADADVEDIESVLASPMLSSPVPMQVDAVHVRVAGVDSAVGSDSESGSLTEESGIAGLPTNLKGDMHYEGKHMHPVSHRPNVPVIAPPVPHGHSHPNSHPHAQPLGITTSFPARESTTVEIESSPENTASASSSFASTSSLTTPSSSEAGETPLSSVFSGEGDVDEKATPQPTVQSPPQGQSSSQRDRTPPRSRSPPSHSHPRAPKTPHPQPRLNSRVCQDPTRPPLLTSTFRPKELLKKDKRKSATLTQEEKARVKAGLGIGTGRLQHHPFSPPPSPKPQSAGVGFVAQQEAVKAKEAARDGGKSGSPSSSSGKGKEKTLREEESWEFCPAKVPDGISLRNFGIQVPIYATVSDIVVYSPHGATPAALTLARRFRAAIKAKRLERMRKAGIDVDLLLEDDSIDHTDSPEVSPVHEHHYHHHHHHGQISIPAASKYDLKTKAREAAAGFIEYQVFVLNADEDEMRKEMPHLMVKMYRDGEDGMNFEFSLSPDALERCDEEGFFGRKGEDKLETGRRIDGPVVFDSGAHTDGPDGHLVELGAVEKAERKLKAEKERAKDDGVDMDMVVDMDVDANFEMDVDRPSSGQRLEGADDGGLLFAPNTVDFALREKEEMRDLTKASEIISLFPESRPSSVALTASPSPSPRPASSNVAFIPNRHSSGSQLGKINSRHNPHVGQVFLGNSGDVPLAPDVPTQFRHASSVPRESEDSVAAKGNLKLLTRHLKGVDGLVEEYGVDDSQEDAEDCSTSEDLPHDDPFNYLATNDPAKGFGFDICIECHDLAPFPTAAHMRAAEEHLGMLDIMWKERWEKAWLARQERKDKDGSFKQKKMSPPPAPPRPPPHANAVIHLPFPSSPNNSQSTLVALIPVIRFLEKWIRPLPPTQPSTRPNTPPELKNLMMIGNVDPRRNMAGAASRTSASPPPPSTGSSTGSGSRRWSSVTALMPSLLPQSFPSFNGLGLGGKEQPDNSNEPPNPPPNAPLPPHPGPRSRSFTSPSAPHPPQIHPPTPVQARTRPLKVLLYSSDGYTESSVPALCLLMAINNLGLPEAYLELQVAKRRSFFVYQADLGVLRRVEGRLKEEKERERERERERQAASGTYPGGGSINANGKRTAPTPAPISPAPAARAGGVYWSGSTNNNGSAGSSRPPPGSSGPFMGRPAAKSVSFARPPPAPSATLPAISSDTSAGSGSLPTQSSMVPHKPMFATSGHIQHASDPAAPDLLQQQKQSTVNATTTSVKGRPRATTSPWLPSLFGGDHQSWFNDPRFDGSFPSRVLPFLYLGNLNHASNVYMLHALGITHVVSVGECALVPPPHHMVPHSAGSHGRTGVGNTKGPSGHGSLWIEEREGRIKVMDIKGVCDDGIDTLEPQLEPICEWIDQARREGGQVLVHCRVGVSRSATVTIAYVMKYLNIPLVDAYLIVRSRRLSVLIQPNMRLLYNLCGWEIKLAKERASGNQRQLKKELSRTLAWPYLAKEVHALNEKYLHAG